jgi:hypothetical protein
MVQIGGYSNMGIIKPPFGAQLKMDHPLSQGLCAAYLFNEGSGNKIYDSSGKGNHGTLKSGFANPPTSTSGWVNNNQGYALAFPGIANGSILIGTIKDLGLVHTVVFGASVNVYGNRYLFDFGGNKSIIRSDDSGPGRWRTYNGSYLASIKTFVLGQQVAVAVAVQDTTGLTFIYIDGTYDAQSSIGTSALGALTIGSYSQLDDGSYNWAGVLSYAYIYNKTLSAQEISSLYAFPYQMFDDYDTYQQRHLKVKSGFFR